MNSPSPTVDTNERPWNDREIDAVALRIKAVAHPLRLAIVCFLLDGERSVSDISEAMGTTQPNISQHLSQLHNQKLLRSQRDGNRVYYSVADSRLRTIIIQLRDIYCPLPD